MRGPCALIQPNPDRIVLLFPAETGEDSRFLHYRFSEIVFFSLGTSHAVRGPA